MLPEPEHKSNTRSEGDKDADTGTTADAPVSRSVCSARVCVACFAHRLTSLRLVYRCICMCEYVFAKSLFTHLARIQPTTHSVSGRGISTARASAAADRGKTQSRESTAAAVAARRASASWIPADAAPCRTSTTTARRPRACLPAVKCGWCVSECSAPLFADDGLQHPSCLVGGVAEKCAREGNDRCARDSARRIRDGSLCRAVCVCAAVCVCVSVCVCVVRCVFCVHCTGRRESAHMLPSL